MGTLAGGNIAADGRYQRALSVGAYKALLQKLKQHCKISKGCYLLEKSPQNIMIYVLAAEKKTGER